MYDPQAVIVVGASAGGMEAFSRLASGLDPALPAAICLVVHITGAEPTAFAARLSRNGPFTAVFPGDGTRLQAGCIYLAPPDRHLVLADSTIRLLYGPRENWNRPAIDPLFRSAAVHYRIRTVGVLLSGLLDDGVDGLRAIQSCGGTTVVQDPSEAMYPDMPQNAVRRGCADHVVSLDAMPELLARLAVSPHGTEPPVPEELLREVAFVEQGAVAYRYGAPDWRETTLACPECGGPLWDKAGKGEMYGCTVGHRFGSDSLAALQDQGIEQALWQALRLLEERGQLQKRLADDESSRGRVTMAEKYRERSEESLSNAERLKQFLQHLRATTN
ncbi:chemotaxis protein CheB [Geomonas oryzisoli]|uniref:Chemotaxis protein CheB n=1 Tax=Geomonas oryzisoli TaxID=2847992 RepID=A0ABX8J8N9_9BACT|nr:chemotaxis protein CheB [Geomonas oryzisoli]QWV93442.1 chemotaxis protein CheB [Geomonas oryzisoli]